MKPIKCECCGGRFWFWQGAYEFMYGRYCHSNSECLERSVLVRRVYSLITEEDLV